MNKQHVTVAQCNAVGIELGVAEQNKPHETFVRMKGEAVLDAKGNLSFEGKTFAPDGKKIETKQTPAQEAKVKQERNHYEKVLDCAKGYETMSKLPAWKRLFKSIRDMHDRSWLELKTAEKKEIDGLQAKVNCPEQMFAVIKTACDNLNGFSKDNDLPLWGYTPATATFNEKMGDVSITGGEKITKEVKKALGKGKKNEGETSSDGKGK